MIRYIDIVFIVSLLILGCSDEKETSWDNPYTSKQAIVLFSPGGIGDMGYNDQILRGIQRVKEEKDFMLLFSSPSSLEEARRIFEDWLDMDTDGIDCLFILGGHEYENMARELLDERKYPDKKVLLFETLNSEIPAYTFSISMYGACYLAGGVVLPFTSDKVAVLCGNSNDATVKSAADGFVKGYTDQGGESADIFCLADDWTGYAMPDSAYRMVARLAGEYSYFFPLAGGSNLGMFRYAREYPDDLYMAGMDVDQSGYSSRITCSVVKNIDRLVGHYLNLWLEGESIPRNKVYGLESGYIDIVVSPGYEKTLLPVVASLKDRAVEEENKFLNQ